MGNEHGDDKEGYSNLLDNNAPSLFLIRGTKLVNRNRYIKLTFLRNKSMDLNKEVGGCIQDA